MNISFHGHGHIVPYPHVITKSYFGWSKHNKNMTKETYRHSARISKMMSDLTFKYIQTFFFKCNF